MDACSFLRACEKAQIGSKHPVRRQAVIFGDRWEFLDRGAPKANSCGRRLHLEYQRFPIAMLRQTERTGEQSRATRTSTDFNPSMCRLATDVGSHNSCFYLKEYPMPVLNDGFLKGLAAPELCNHHQLSSAISVFWPRTRGLSPVIPMSAMMSIYQGDGTRDDASSVFIGVDEDRSDRLRVAFGIPCKTVASFECSVKGARELAQWLFDRGIQEWAEFPSASTLRLADERFPSGRPKRIGWP
jgi:hypothetical protein